MVRIFTDGKKRFFSRFLQHGILTLSHFSAITGKVMSWTETTIRMNRNDTLAVMIDSVNYRNLLRLCVTGFPFSISILSGCFDSLLSPTSSTVLLAFLIILRAEYSNVSEVSINYVARLAALNSTGSLCLFLHGCLKG